MNKHTLTVDWTGGYGPTYRLNCNAPTTSDCHVVYDCACEEYSAYGRDHETNRPWHMVQVWSESENGGQTTEYHYGRFDPDECVMQGWFDGIGDELLHGALTVPVRAEWDGGNYVFYIEKEGQTND